jgi:hypothetical protein
MQLSYRLGVVAGFLGLLAFAACSSSSSPSTTGISDGGPDLDASADAEPEPDDAADAADAAPAPKCTGDAGDPCVACDLAHCCDERQACVTDTTCKTAYDQQIACIGSTDAGTAARHNCFMTFEGKGQKAQAYHFCEEGSCKGPTACAIP